MIDSGTIVDSTGYDGSDIPVIDFSRHREEREIVSELLYAFSTIGFCTLVHHGVPSDLFRKAFRASRDFFALPIETKVKYKYKTPSSNRGYIPYGMEQHDKDKEGNFLPAAAAALAASNDTKTTLPDLKETMDIGYDDDEDSGDSDIVKNEWPQELSPQNFKDVLKTYFAEMDALNLRLMKYIGQGLGLPDDGDYLVRKCNGKHENLRLLHYPSVTPTVGDDTQHTTVRGNAHTDFGTLTLLVQDVVGGLKVKRNDGTWIDVQPLEDSIIVNVGDMLMRWTNDRLKATLHKVESPKVTMFTHETSDTSEKQDRPVLSTKAIVPERYSIAFFCNANKDVEIECLETCIVPTEVARYPPINAHQYLTNRLSATIRSEPRTPS